MLKLPAGVVDGGEHSMLREDGYFGIRLQVKKEFKTQQVVTSARTVEIMDEEKRIADDKKAQALLQAIPRDKLFSMLGISKTNTNDVADDVLLVPTSEIRNHMDVEPSPEEERGPWNACSGSLSDDSIRTSDEEKYTDDEEDAS
jgi:hypothetical protein